MIAPTLSWTEITAIATADGYEDVLPHILKCGGKTYKIMKLITDADILRESKGDSACCTYFRGLLASCDSAIQAIITRQTADQVEQERGLQVETDRMANQRLAKRQQREHDAGVESERVRKEAFVHEAFLQNEANLRSTAAAAAAPQTQRYIGYATLVVLDPAKAKLDIPSIEKICRCNIAGHAPAEGFHISEGVMQVVRDPTIVRGLPQKWAMDLNKEITKVGAPFATWFMACAPILDTTCAITKSVFLHALKQIQYRGVRILIMNDANAANTQSGAVPFVNIQTTDIFFFWIIRPWMPTSLMCLSHGSPCPC